LTIGSLETTAAFRLTPLLAGFAANYPDVDFVLRTGTIRKLVAATLEQSVDGAFVCGPVGQPDLREEVGKDGIVPIACVNAARDIFAAPPGSGREAAPRRFRRRRRLAQPCNPPYRLLPSQ
jgi:DNA-binding transcriptional LysR family regulator